MQPGVPVNMADQSQFGFDFAKQYNYQGSRLSKFSNSVAGRSSLRFDISKGSGYGRYHQLNDAESSHHMLDRSSSSYKKREHAPGKGYGPKKKQMQYSGPLVPPPDGNMKEMAKDHKVQVQHAVRKAHKYTKNENGQRESLLR
ncbi:hypothetical protein L6452_01560 [Arctium lappa]|uniref:Uncharacterized protein n=1 Tax=Arctium lappa TaxID=4217 RepID=A0ACB9FIG8_ARCLA|nr:hypothetical protein L6452_01560 [Arctium lappa]